MINLWSFIELYTCDLWQWLPTPTLAWKIPWTEEPGRLQSMGSLRVWHDWATSLHFSLYALEKKMATHSSVLAWRVPVMGEPGGLPSMGSHRVGHDWSDLAAAAAACTFLNIYFNFKRFDDLNIRNKAYRMYLSHYFYRTKTKRSKEHKYKWKEKDRWQK